MFEQRQAFKDYNFWFFFLSFLAGLFIKGFDNISVKKNKIKKNSERVRSKSVFETVYQLVEPEAFKKFYKKNNLSFLPNLRIKVGIFHPLQSKQKVVFDHVYIIGYMIFFLSTR